MRAAAAKTTGGGTVRPGKARIILMPARKTLIRRTFARKTVTDTRTRRETSLTETEAETKDRGNRKLTRGEVGLAKSQPNFFANAQGEAIRRLKAQREFSDRSGCGPVSEEDSTTLC